MKQFNINSTVKVRLTEYGKELHKNQWKEFWSSVGKLDKHPYKPLETDADGYCEFMMWNLMNKFGSYMILGCEVPFETTILIDEKDLKDE
jgi:hypothetical protein